jgi:hypothetical protein
LLGHRLGCHETARGHESAGAAFMLVNQAKGARDDRPGVWLTCLTHGFPARWMYSLTMSGRIAQLFKSVLCGHGLGVGVVSE